MEQLYIIKHAAPEAYADMVTRFTALEKQVEETGLWKEVGSSQEPEPDKAKVLVSKAAEMAKSQGIPIPEAFQRMDADGDFKALYEQYRDSVGQGVA